MKKTTFATREEWLEARKSSIGGSDSPVIAGVSPYTSPLSLYCEKAGLVEPSKSDDQEEFLRFGNLLEPIVAQIYSEQTKRSLVDHGLNMFRGNFDFPSHASLDREIVSERGPGVLQIKTTGKYSMKELQDDLPVDWQVQIQHEMANAGFDWGSFAVLFVHSRKLGHIDIERNEPFIATLLEAERKFWARVVNHDPPDVDGSESTTAILKALHPKDSGESVSLPPEAYEWDDALRMVKHDLAELEGKKTLYENKMKAAIGDASLGLLPDGTSYSWKLQKRAGFTIKPTEFRVLRKLNQKEG